MGIVDVRGREEGELEIERQLAAAIGEIDVKVGFQSSIEVEVGLCPDDVFVVTLANPNAKVEALSADDYDLIFDWKYFKLTERDPVQQALAWVRTECEPEVLRQKRQAEILEAIKGLLDRGEEKPPVSRRWPQRKKWDGATRPEPLDHTDDGDDEDDDSPPVKKRPRKGPPPPDPPFYDVGCVASVRFDPPDGLDVLLIYDSLSREVTETRYFKLPEDGSLTEVYEWIRALDRQVTESAGLEA
jgi:hypothetical protein